jgi:uncharacterized small protein (DUF1192 family)
MNYGIQEAEQKLAAYNTIQVQQNLTVEENIDNKIRMMQAEIDRLEASKKELAPLLGMKIRDIREAMNY